MDKYIERARIEGFTNWLSEEANRGWHTCLLTGKKFRGQEAKDMIEMQKQAIIEWETEAKQEEAEYEAQVIADIEQYYLESQEAEQTNTENDHAEALILDDDDGIEVTDNLRQYLLTHPGTKTIVINCSDCGKKRRIKPQDAFQVKRCVSCQKKHRNKLRAERHKQKAQESEKIG